MLQKRRSFPDLPQATENTSKWQQHSPVFQRNYQTFSLTFAHPIQVKLCGHTNQMQDPKYHLSRFQLIATMVVSYTLHTIHKFVSFEGKRDCFHKYKAYFLPTLQCLKIFQFDPKFTENMWCGRRVRKSNLIYINTPTSQKGTKNIQGKKGKLKELITCRITIFELK